MPRRSQRHRRQKPSPQQKPNPPTQGLLTDPVYQQARAFAEAGDCDRARATLVELQTRFSDGRQRALLENDLGTLAATHGQWEKARRHFLDALAGDDSCESARKNLAFLDEFSRESATLTDTGMLPVADPTPRQARVAILSLLFNWPSAGGGTVHTAETGKFLSRAGYDVQHIYASYPDWGLGTVTEPTGVASVPLTFDSASWNAQTIQGRFREAVDAFRPDYVIITDSWNSKPLLAEAVRGYRYFLRLAALECLCPLNNVRLLHSPETGTSACPRQQLATPDLCRKCVATYAHQSGTLHQSERTLAGFDSPDYSERLRRAFADAEGVLVVNPLIAAMVAPFAKVVHVVPSGFDPERFPWPAPEPTPDRESRPTRLFFAGLVDEAMKGFSVLQNACRQLWRKRQDFEVLATADPVGQVNPFTRYIGWQTQTELPRQLRQADILVFPTIAEEALGRSAVEAMGCGIPVIASRLGGLPYTVTDGLTGLLFEPGNPVDLAAQIEILLDDPDLRRRMGAAGQKRFERDFTWGTIIDRHYRRLFSPAAEAPHLLPPSAPYSPRFVDRVDHSRLIRDAADWFSIPQCEVERMFRTYRDYSALQDYARTLGEWKTLTCEEAFVIGLLLSLTRPPVIVEIGTQQGKSVRRIVDLVAFLGIPVKVICYDIVDQLRYVTPDEVDMREKDLSGVFRAEVLDRYGGGFLFLDTHGYALLREVIQETVDHFGNWSLAIHDCGRGLCNPRMTIERADPRVTSDTGVWERYVLAEAFGVNDPLCEALDHCRNAHHRLRIFETQHGLGVIMPARTGSPLESGAEACAELTAAV